MRVVARWGLAVALSAAAFAVSWWVSQELVHLDEGAALGVAGAVLAVVLAVAGWWAARERPGGAGRAAAGRRVVQKARGGRDVNIAGRDQTVVNYRRQDE
jgi:nitrate/nitrite transporter NarK